MGDTATEPSAGVDLADPTGESVQMLTGKPLTESVQTEERSPSSDDRRSDNGADDPPEHRSVVFLAGSLAGGNIIAMALRMVGGVLLGRFISPAALGLFNGIGLVLGYAPVLQAGILNGLNRELPYFVGAGDRQKVKELAAAAQAWALLIAGVVALSLLGIAAWDYAHGQPERAAAWAANSIMAFFLFYGTYYLQNTFRSAHNFARLAVANVVESTFALLLLVAVAFLGFYGLCIRSVLVGTAGFLLLYYWRPIRVGPRWNFSHLKHLLVIGAPIFAVGQIYTLWGGVINSTLVLRLSGTEGMGLYAMVALAWASLDLIPQAVAQVIYPRMAEEYGRSSELTRLVEIARKPMLLTFAALIPLVAIAWVAVGPLMRILIPNFADAVPAMRWALLIPLASSFQPLNSLFNVIRRQDLYMAAIAFGMAVYGGSLLLFAKNGPVSLTAFPQALLIGRAAYLLLSYYFIGRVKKRRRTTGEASR
jgi:O-antigen/teichoic acid export membrane protein